MDTFFPFIGAVHLFSFDFAPDGWATCEGQLLPIDEHTALFSLLGTRFGGDGVREFALPDLRGKAPPNLQFCIALRGVYPRDLDRGLHHRFRRPDT
jgi:microcystin-dependent protein